MKLPIKDRIGLIGFFIKTLFAQIDINKKAGKLGYYTSIEDIPIFNWDKIEGGKYEFLFKDKQGEIPEFFQNIISDMFFQFEKINMGMIEKRHKLAYLRNLYATTNRVDFLNKARHLESEIQIEENQPIKKSTLNEKVNYIESVFNSIGSIKVKEMSASRFYSLLNLAMAEVEKRNRHGVN